MNDRRRGAPARWVLGLLSGWVACGGTTSPPRPGEPGADALPPIPERSGAVALRVQYPTRGQRIAASDSNFLFGTVGTGDATLEIDGRRVPVEANGAFLAWLPVPPRGAGDTARYRLVARRGATADTLTWPVLLPARPPRGPAGEVWLDTAALAAAPERWALPDDEIELEVWGAPGLDVWLDAGGERFRMAEWPHGHAPEPGEAEGVEAGRYRALLPAGRLWEAACQVAQWADPERPSCAGATDDRSLEGGTGDAAGSEADRVPVSLVASDGWSTVRLERTLRLRLLAPRALPVAELREAPDSVNGASGVVVGRTTPYGPYRWRFPEGTRAAVTGRVADRLRLRLTSGLAAWVLAEDAALLPPGAAPPVAEVRDVRVQPESDRLVVRLGLESPLPAHLEQPDSHTLALTLYGAHGTTNRIAHGEADALLHSLDWEQLPGRRYRLLVRLTRPVWGYRLAYEAGEASAYEGPRGGGGAARRWQPGEGDPVLRLEIRRTPAIERSHPLRGRRVAIDPGHPGGGSRGPTGYYEAEANLAVARRLAELLRREGAEPLLTRTDSRPLGLYERTARAREAGADLFVSIHNNALPDGVRPFGREGTSTYFYQSHSAELARHVQAGMLRRMRLRDLGVAWGDLAVTRMTWMPAILTEGAFMMMPRHEAALRTPEFQERYARGVMEGLRDFLSSRAHR